MTPQIRNWLILMKKKHFAAPPARVLEIGACDVNGQIRDVFADAQEYIGVDIAEGRNVDMVVNGHDTLTKFGPQSFDLVLCLETLEHDDLPHVTIGNIRELVKLDGILIVSTPTTGFPEHRYPRDYWRFMPDAYRDIIFKDFMILALDSIRDYGGLPGLIGMARKGA
jgi:SAM-dependent methyltransferase